MGLVKNLQSWVYWSGTAYAPYPWRSAWYFAANYGRQYIGTQDLGLSAWAVREGDVAPPVPEPETYALFLAGPAVMGGALRRRARKAG